MRKGKWPVNSIAHPLTIEKREGRRSIAFALVNLHISSDLGLLHSREEASKKEAEIYARAHCSMKEELKSAQRE